MAKELNYVEIGKRIRAMRLNMGIPTGSEAAERWGYTQSKWSRMENGRDITPSNLEDLAGRCFGVPVEWLMFGRVLRDPAVEERHVEAALRDAEEELRRLTVRKAWLEDMKKEEEEVNAHLEAFVEKEFGISGAGGIAKLHILDFDSDEALEGYLAALNRE